MEDTQEKQPESPAAPSTLEKHVGYIAYFDILGYQSFLEGRNTPEDATKDVLTSILNANEEVPRRVTAVLGEDVKEELELFRWLIFSDTILIAAPEGKDASVTFYILGILAACLQRYMFDFGLPVRGAISAGPFVLAKTCFAGLPIIEAYKLSNRLDVSTCVVADSAISKMQGDVMFDSMISLRILFDYRVPLNDSTEKDFYIVSPMLATLKPGWKDRDVSQLVAEAFWKNNKQVGRAAIPKVLNTEMLMRFIKMRSGDEFY